MPMQVQVEGGLFRCRVVIPDAKDSEKDILLWWNDGKYAGHGGVQSRPKQQPRHPVPARDPHLVSV